MLLPWWGSASLEARTINVRGKVVRQGTHEPLEGVTIRNAETDRLVGTTNMEGQFTVTADDAGSLLFSVLGSEDRRCPWRDAST